MRNASQLHAVLLTGLVGVSLWSSGQRLREVWKSRLA